MFDSFRNTTPLTSSKRETSNFPTLTKRCEPLGLKKDVPKKSPLLERFFATGASYMFSPLLSAPMKRKEAPSSEGDPWQPLAVSRPKRMKIRDTSNPAQSSNSSATSSSRSDARRSAKDHIRSQLDGGAAAVLLIFAGAFFVLDRLRVLFRTVSR